MTTLHEKIRVFCGEDLGASNNPLEDEPIALDDPVEDHPVRHRATVGASIGEVQARIVDIHVPFWSIFFIALKTMFALIPAVIVFVIIMNILSAIGLFGGWWGLMKLFPERF